MIGVPKRLRRGEFIWLVFGVHPDAWVLLHHFSVCRVTELRVFLHLSFTSRTGRLALTQERGLSTHSLQEGWLLVDSTPLSNRLSEKTFHVGPFTSRTKRTESFLLKTSVYYLKSQRHFHTSLIDHIFLVGRFTYRVSFMIFFNR